MRMPALTISKRLKTMSCLDPFVGVGIRLSRRPSPRLTIVTILRFAPRKFGLFRSPTVAPNGYINLNCINTYNDPLHPQDQAVCKGTSSDGLFNSSRLRTLDNT